MFQFHVFEFTPRKIGWGQILTPSLLTLSLEIIMDCILVDPSMSCQSINTILLYLFVRGDHNIIDCLYVYRSYTTLGRADTSVA